MRSKLHLKYNFCTCNVSLSPHHLRQQFSGQIARPLSNKIRQHCPLLALHDRGGQSPPGRLSSSSSTDLRENMDIMENNPPAPTRELRLVGPPTSPEAATTPTAAAGPLRYRQQLGSPGGSS